MTTRRDVPTEPTPPHDSEAALTPAPRVERGAPMEIGFEITVVDGEAGRRLSVVQAAAILDALTWLHQHRRPAGQPG